jgi:hypothetical protein
MRATVSKQVLGGIRMIGVGLLFLFLLYILLDGFRRIYPEGQRISRDLNILIGVIEIFVVSVILWMTIHMWSGWVAAVAFFIAVKSLLGLVAGTTVSPPFRPVSRLVPAETLVYLTSAGLLSMRFLSHRPKALERVALVVLVLATCAEMLFEPSPLCLLVGLGPLAGVRLAAALSPDSPESLS